MGSSDKHCSCLFICLLKFANFGRVTATAHDANFCRTRNSLSSYERETITLGTMCPTLYKHCVGSLMYKGCETGPTVYCPYLRRV